MEKLELKNSQPPIDPSIFKWKHFIFAVLVYGLLMFASIIPLVIFDEVTGTRFSDKILNGPYQGLFLDAIIVLLVILMIRPFRLQVFRKTTWQLAVFKQRKTYIVILGVLVTNFVFQQIVNGIYQLESNDKQLKSLNLDPNDHYSWITLFLIFLAIAILTPVKEEILYRLLPKLLLGKYHVLILISLSTVVFAAGHTGAYISAGFMGLLFMLSYLYTRSLWVSITIHIIWNFYSYCMLFLL
ncbi:CPBP family intramembrane glutamic endopeptidase [Neobacillus sp. D3-1R]|uniref:CPBP family intramembrane glutamic endopeptidase n=1 Tax=Neobacillus sp. D3-1R TaxID=3445778 RepID=UPI003FA0ECB4